MAKKESSRYAEAGVDIDKGNEFVERIKPMVASTFRSGVLTGIGGFGGLFALGSGKYKDPVLVSSTDGVGTKLLIAQMCNRHDTIGIDLVAMCVNDIVVSGAQPLFFLDYFSSGGLDLEVAAAVVQGIAKGCEISRCSLIGGETAEMPGMYSPGEYDLAGFVVGICERDKIIDGSDIRVGDTLIGLASSGVHSNGYSLVRKICFEEMKLSVNDHIEEFGCTLGEELLRPTRIYTEPLLNLIKNFRVKGLVHITGGGIIDNLPRVLPNGCKAVLDGKSWEVPPVFEFLRQNGKVSAEEMCRTFNNGIGMVVVVDAKEADDVRMQLQALGEKPFVIGEIAARSKKKKDEPLVEIDCD
ncbi:phosphoribosylformylglycinamidine cyclo-ligase [Desulfurivibrio dismutans]|uniref:phosphoribosylformylglycinamidine cyclo-ligase n=1 Tax=Desulfurivibrio dismutans TaxID=1398908 RepID=UPI0023DB2BB5|nr:phosphoribosylformylglycinamidine cyclo-ligase [Desulfurivibrio alkaliphilus]MDF1614772.1 phosphoribosylformylglycinamidine cyclo-ligase [Desulfurivibrio alkaliphilus]